MTSTKPVDWSWDIDLAPSGPRRRYVEPATPTVTDPGVTVTSLWRCTAAVALVLAFLIGQVAAATGLRLLGQLGASAFLQLGPGVAFCLVVRPAQRHMFAMLSVVVGASITTLVAMLASLTGAVSLSTVWVVLAALTLAVLVAAGLSDVPKLRTQSVARVRARRAAAESGGRPRLERWPRPAPPALLTVLGLGLALVAAVAHAGPPRPAGAAVAAGPLWFVGAALVVAAVILAWCSRAALAVPVLGLSSVVIATQGLMYREPTAVVAARHIGLVDYLLVHGRLDRSTDIYQAWAGLFASAALDVRAASLSDLFGYAAWWGVLAAPVMVLGVRCVAGAFVDERRSWLAALLFGLGSSLNTSFFAPQVLGFIMALTVLALLAAPPGVGVLSPRVRILTAALISVPLALTHQISPYMLTLALVALTLFGIVRPWWVFAVPAVPAVVWALVNKHLLSSYVSTSAFGKLLENLAPPDNAIGVFPVPLVNRLTFLLPAAALVCIGLAALLVLVRSRNRLTWGLACAAGSPVVLMAGTSYGNEGIFRVVLFALPWLAILACLATQARPAVLPARLRGLAFSVAVTLLTVVNIIGLTGMDWARVVRPGDVAATSWLERTAPSGSLILSLGTDFTIPDDSSARYGDTNWTSRTTLISPPDNPYPTTTGAAYDAAADLTELTNRLTAQRATRYYAVAADSVGAYDERYGNQRYDDHQKLTTAIAASRRWRLVHSDPGIRVYELRAAKP